MTDAQRRLMHARQKVEAFFINPITELVAATAALCAAEKARADAAEASLEKMRPVWAQGFTSDSEAAQASFAALGEIWQMLDVDNQTAAMKALRDILT